METQPLYGLENYKEYTFFATREKAVEYVIAMEGMNRGYRVSWPKQSHWGEWFTINRVTYSPSWR